MSTLKDFLTSVTQYTLSLIGTALTTISATLFVMIFALELYGFRGGPYLGILTYLILPGLFVLGLILIPIGRFCALRFGHMCGREGMILPVIDFNQLRTRKFFILITLLFALSIVILGVSTYKSVQVMDSTEFCGFACHTAMSPEHTAYKRSPHARVKCVECHVGSGAKWLIKSKLSGTWKLIAASLDLYPRPIPSPVHNMRPASETCEQCHWPTRYIGDRLKVKTIYEDDETNTELKTVMIMNVGGLQGDQSHGIHWHVDPNIQIRYLADAKREAIYDVELTEADGSKKLFRTSTPAPKDAIWRSMDCIDCHNRPTHIYRQPEEEVDLAILEGRIDRALPFIKREAVRILKTRYSSHEQARAGLAKAIRLFYKEHYPELYQTQIDAVVAAGREIGNIYTSNVFPTMQVFWDTYPNHLGHEVSPGCYRCHDKKHRNTNGERISKDCEICHAVLAELEEDPEIIKQLQP